MGKEELKRWEDRGGHGIANTKRGESFKEGLVIYVTAPKIRLKEPNEEWVLTEY